MIEPVSRQTRRIPTRSKGGRRSVNWRLVGSLCLVGLWLSSSAPPAQASEAAEIEAETLGAYADLPLSSVRFLGTHNSYHRKPRLFGIPFLPITFSGSHRYAHRALGEQLEGLEDGTRAVRQLEIDVHMRRIGNQLRVFHLPWIDNQSSCKTLALCLGELIAWSDAREGRHAPVLVWIEPKDETPLDRWLTLGWYEHVQLTRVEEVILDVIPRDRILTPDDVRGDADTLAGAIRERGWPSLGETTGRFMFALLDESEHRETYVARTKGRTLEGQVMFVRSTSGQEPYAAMFKVNTAVPTLRDMQVFGREALQDPELSALQVYPPPPAEERPDSRFEAFFKNLWVSKGDQAEEDAAAEGTPDDEQAMEAERTRGGFAEEKNALDPALDEMEVSRALHRELEAVHVDTRADARARHEAAVAALEEETLLTHAPESEALAIVLRNARESRRYRQSLVLMLRGFLEETERARILQLVRQGFLVTTTADDAQKSEDANRERAASALISAAQYISTDVLMKQGTGGYVMPFPGRPFACNAMLDPDGCAAVRDAPGKSRESSMSKPHGGS